MILDPARCGAILTQARQQHAPPPSAAITLLPYETATSDPTRAPYDKIQAFHDSPAKVRCIFGANRSSKSTAGAVQLLRQALTEPGEYWMVALTQKYLRISAKKLFQFLPENQFTDIAWANRAQKIPDMLRLPNGSEIYGLTCAAGAGSMQASSVRGVWIDEDPDNVVAGAGREIYNELMLRITDCAGRLWITATPLFGYNWLYTDLYQQARTGGDIEAWTVTIYENKYLPLKNIEAIEALLTPEEKARRLRGEFAMVSGGIYKQFSRQTHVIPPLTVIPWGVRIVRGLDLGFNNATAMLWAFVDDDNRIVVFDEYYQNASDIETHATAMRAIDRHWKIDGRIEATLADHDRQVVAEYAKYGIDTSPADKDVETGIDLVSHLMMPRAEMAGQSALVVTENCQHTIEEVEKYHWKRVRGTQNTKPEPDKVDDHTCDALRYIVKYTHSGTVFDLDAISFAEPMRSQPSVRW